MLIGTVRICFVDGTIQEIECVKSFVLKNDLKIYQIEVNEYYIFINAEQVRYIGRAFDIDNRYER